MSKQSKPEWDYPCHNCNPDCDPNGNGRDCEAPACVLYNLAYEIHYALWQNHMNEDREAGLFCCGCDHPEDVHECPYMQRDHGRLLAFLKHYEDEARERKAKAKPPVKSPRTPKVHV